MLIISMNTGCSLNPRGLLDQQHIERKSELGDLFLFFLAALHSLACGISVPQPGTEPAPSAVKARSPNHWTAREFPRFISESHINCYCLQCLQGIICNYFCSSDFFPPFNGRKLSGESYYYFCININTDHSTITVGSFQLLINILQLFFIQAVINNFLQLKT